MRKLILAVTVFAMVAVAFAMPPPKELGGVFQQVNSQYDAQATHAIYVAPLAEPELQLASLSKDQVGNVMVAAGMRSSCVEKRGEGKGATAVMLVDRSRGRPLLL